MPGSLQLQMPNRLDALPDVVNALLNFLHAQGTPDSAVFAANLAMEELITNVIKYGYDENEPHTITIRVETSAKELLMTVIDDGHPFNPFLAPEPDTATTVEERAIGGLGIHFIRNLLDTYHYERRGNENHVTVTKSLAPEEG